MTGAEVHEALRDILRRELVRMEAARHHGVTVLAETPADWPHRDDLARKISEMDDAIAKVRARIGRTGLN